MKNVIIGYGIVGQNIHKELSRLEFDVIDTGKRIKCISKHHKIGFVCVPTDLTNRKSLDISNVFRAIDDNDCDYYVIKSTVNIGDCEIIAEHFKNKHIVYSPEYYGGTQHCNNFDFNFTVLSGNKNDCNYIIQELQKTYDGRHKFYVTNYKIAEIAKFMENSWLAYKVSFCNMFNNLCEQEDVDYEELREIFIADPRVNESHTFVYKEHPYFDSHCLNKDVPAIAYSKNMQLLKDIITFNEKQKERYG